MELIKQRTAEQLQKLVDASFNLNSVFDNIVYGLEKELRMPKFASFIHQKLAHAYPSDFADAIQEFAISKGVRIFRGVVQSNSKIFNSAINAIDDGLSALLSFEELLNNAIDVCIEENSKAAEDFLRGLSVDVLTKHLFQMNLFRDGLLAYEDDNIVSSFNKDFESYIIDYFKG